MKILCVWHTIASPNYGVSALALSNLSMLNEIAKDKNEKFEVSLVGTLGKNMETQDLDRFRNLKLEKHQSFSVRKVFGKKSGLLAYISSVRESNLVIDISEGDSFTNIYGKRRFFLQCLTKTIAIFLKKPLILAPQTYGPFKKNLIANIILKYIFNFSKLVVARDKLSAKVATSFGANPMCVPDIAFGLPPEKRVNRVRYDVIINVSGLLFNNGCSEDSSFCTFGSYKNLIERLIGHFLDAGRSVALYPHVYAPSSPSEDDLLASQDLSERFRGLPIIMSVGPSDAKSNLKGANLFLGSRMHACIGALSMGVPVVSLAYSRKFKGAFEQIGYTETVNLYEIQSENEAFNEILLKCENANTDSVNRSMELYKKSEEKYKSSIAKILNEIKHEK